MKESMGLCKDRACPTDAMLVLRSTTEKAEVKNNEPELWLMFIHRLCQGM